MTDQLISIDSPDAHVPIGTPPDVEALLRAQALLRQKGIAEPTCDQLIAAVKEVFSARHSLGQKFKFQPDTLARQRGAE